MNEFNLDPPSGKNLTPRRLEREAPSSKKPENRATQNASFQKVLESVVDKATGSPEIRQDLVNKYKVSLANGTYEVKAQELAEKMIQKIRESKTRGII
jgi:anti-sigma28 factor (negative regulator of flagellin synthesis)